MTKTSPFRLAVGSGRSKRPGWVTLDADPKCRPTIVASVPPLPEEVTASRWDEIEMIHFIEHLFVWEAEELVSQCRRVLRPGGKLVLEAPNLMFAAEVLAGVRPKPNGHPDQFTMWVLHGDPRAKNPLYGHKWSYTPETLTELLVRSGFPRSGIRRHRARHHHPIRDFRLEAVV